MKKRLAACTGGVFSIALIVALVIPTSRHGLSWASSGIIGLMRNERFEDGRPTSSWISALKDSDAEERQRAAKALGYIGEDAGEEAAPALAKALKDEVGLVRLNAALALFKMGAKAKAAVPELAGALKDEHPLIRLDAVLALHRMQAEAKPALPALIAALEDDANRQFIWPFGRSVREMAARSLGRIGPEAREAIPALTVLVEQHANDAEYEAAAWALKQIDPEAATKAGVP